jgi:hypothetical protein
VRYNLAVTEFMTRQAPANVEQTIHVHNINYETTSKALGQVFGKFGSVKAVRVIATFDGRDCVGGMGLWSFTLPMRPALHSTALNRWWLMVGHWRSASAQV